MSEFSGAANQNVCKRRHVEIDDDDAAENAVLSPESGSFDAAACLERISDILKCKMCQKVPLPADFMDCGNGHSLCSPCAYKLLADEVLHKTAAICIGCNAAVAFYNLKRVMSVSCMIAELKTKCEVCQEVLQHKNLAAHKQQECTKRKTECQYGHFGCPWQGAFDICQEHEVNCDFPHKNGAEITKALEEAHKSRKEKIFDLHRNLSAGVFDYKDAYLKVTIYQDPNVPCFQTKGLMLHSYVWRILAYVDDTAGQRHMTYSLKIISKIEQPVFVNFCLVHMQESEAENLFYEHNFNPESLKSAKNPLGIEDVNVRNRFLAQQYISVRLLLFLH